MLSGHCSDLRIKRRDNRMSELYVMMNIMRREIQLGIGCKLIHQMKQYENMSVHCDLFISLKLNSTNHRGKQIPLFQQEPQRWEKGRWKKCKRVHLCNNNKIQPKRGQWKENVSSWNVPLKKPIAFQWNYIELRS